VGEADTMVRLVISEGGEVAVDLAGGAFGRGAHLHSSLKCLDGAPRGLAKSFKRQIGVTPGELARAIVTAADRRALGLLSSAARSGKVQIGADLAGEAFGTGKVALLVVARDAKSAASVGSVMHAVAKGGAVAWGTKEELGSLVNKSEVGVLGIVSQPIAAALRSVVTMASSVRERATATEDR
jgi:ribosomal protein L7Ae-like RNA K-turn-binding protein